jgi:hypothetical protein
VSVDVDRFAEILARRLAAIVPDRFGVEADDGTLRYFTDQPGAGSSATYVRENFGVYGDSDEDNLVGIAVQALSEVQDYVSEATAEPWPGRTRQPPPHAEIRDGNLQLWYGDVVLAVDPIPLAAIGGP